MPPSQSIKKQRASAPDESESDSSEEELRTVPPSTLAPTTKPMAQMKETEGDNVPQLAPPQAQATTPDPQGGPPKPEARGGLDKPLRAPEETGGEPGLHRSTRSRRPPGRYSPSEFVLFTRFTPGLGIKQQGRSLQQHQLQ